MPRNHYIPKLVLRQFAVKDRVNTFDVQKQCFSAKKLKNVFCEENLFPNELEQRFARDLEGPFGDLLNHKLLADVREISVNREENFLIRKFDLIHRLRSVYINQDPDEMMKKAGEADNPSYIFLKSIPKMAQILPSNKTFLQDLEMAMNCRSLEDLYYNHGRELSPSLFISAKMAIASYYAIWDSEQSGEEFILSKLPGISLQDQYGPLYKRQIMLKYRANEWDKISEIERDRFEVLFTGILGNADNYWILPLSPTRALVGISPYFKAFFPQPRGSSEMPYIPALLPREQFIMHFYEPMQMDLFEPCRNYDNLNYTFFVKDLTRREVMHQNALALNEEMEEWAFHDYNRIRDSLWAYEHVFTMVKKKRDYSKWM